MNKILTMVTVFVVVFSMFLTMVSLVKTQTNEWSEPQQLTTDPAYDHYASIMQDSSGKIWLVWARGRELDRNLWYKTSSDGGASWSTSKILVSDILTASGTSLLQESTGRIWVAWAGGPKFSIDIFYITSDNGGLSWSPPQQLTDYPGDDNIPSLIEVSGEVWVVFRSYGLSNNEDIWYKKTNDGGATWSAPIQLTSHPSWERVPNAVVDSTGKVWVVWNRNDDIYYKTSIDNGASWSPDQELTNHPFHDGHPNIIEDVSGKIFVFHNPNHGVTTDIWYKTTADSGNTWSDSQELTADTYNNNVPYAALINDEVWVIWQSDRSGNYDIWMSKIAPVPAAIDIDPDTLNLKSNGQWITAYITLPEGYNVEDIVLETVYLDGISAAWSEIQNGVYMVKFDRATVQTSLTNEPDYDSTPKFYDLLLTVTGELVDGTPFEGNDTTRVLSK